jgi:molybdenum cofactor cytidylyltransferase
MQLHQAFDLVPGDVISFIGAGGKTSLLVALGYELAESGWRVLATTSVPMEAHQLELMPYAMAASAGADAISQALTEYQFVFLYDTIQRGVVKGVRLENISHLLDAVDSDVFLIEADMAHGLLFKAPLPHEPNIPSETSLVISVGSMGALTQTLDDAHVYNLQAMIERYGFPEGTRIKSPWLAQIMRDDELGLRGVPAHVRVMGFLNQTPEKGYGRGRARMIAKLILRSSRFHGVVLGAVRSAKQVYEVQRPMAAVILADGLADGATQAICLKRETDGRARLEHIVEQLVKSRVDFITVVTGHQAREMKNLLKRLDVKVAHNKNFKSGDVLSAIKTGLSAQPSHIAGVLLVGGDQARLQPKTLYHLMSAYAETSADLLVPRYRGQRGYPLILGRRYWGEILKMDDHAVWTRVLEAYPREVRYVDVDTDSSILMAVSYTHLTLPTKA